MKKIIGNKFYDTEESEKICSLEGGSMIMGAWFNIQVQTLYKTKNGEYFIVDEQMGGFPHLRFKIVNKTEAEEFFKACSSDVDKFENVFDRKLEIA